MRLTDTRLPLRVSLLDLDMKFSPIFSLFRVDLPVEFHFRFKIHYRQWGFRAKGRPNFGTEARYEEHMIDIDYWSIGEK